MRSYAGGRGQWGRGARGKPWGTGKKGQLGEGEEGAVEVGAGRRPTGVEMRKRGQL